MAQDAEMSLDEYTAFVYEACKLNEDDPIAAWKKVEAEQEAIANRMNGTKWLHIKGKDTDLKLKWKVGNGKTAADIEICLMGSVYKPSGRQCRRHYFI